MPAPVKADRPHWVDRRPGTEDPRVYRVRLAATGYAW